MTPLDDSERLIPVYVLQLLPLPVRSIFGEDDGVVGSECEEPCPDRLFSRMPSARVVDNGAKARASELTGVLRPQARLPAESVPAD